jgi:hypothetical protein
MSKVKHIKATPRADRLRDFVAARAHDERMNFERRSFVSDLASGAAIVDLLGSEFKIAKQMLSIGIEWLEGAYDGRVGREPTDMDIATFLHMIEGSIRSLPGVFEAHRVGCDIKLDDYDCKLWMSMRASEDPRVPSCVQLRFEPNEDFLAAVRRVAKTFGLI